VQHLTVSSDQGRFRSIAQDVIDRAGRNNVFGNVAINLAEPVNIFAEWTGEDLNAGVSLVPFRRIPLVITPALVDLTHKASDRTRFNLGAAYLFSF
jgi:hypothetical protein